MAKTMRYSRQRERIYQYLTQTREHPTAERIYTDLRQELPELSLGTVYRNLKLLEDLGRIRRVAGISGNERYDAICEDHVHFFCQTCGSIRDLQDIHPSLFIDAISLDEGYRISKLDMMLTGRCPQCTAAAET